MRPSTPLARPRRSTAPHSTAAHSSYRPSRAVTTRILAMKQLINQPESVVVEAIEGFVRSHAHLQRLDGFPGIKVVYNKHHDKNKVAVISGGGSGHEPAHAGYVGHAMLSAAVCGEVFASPSAEAVLAAIRTVTGPAGCLLVIKNYTGDRLHFGLAAEQAKSEGLQVEMVVVGEDVAIEKPGLAGRRGLAGTVLVHKVAGALAAGGATLQDVVSAASRVAQSQGTLGVALRVCTLPGKEPSDRLGPGEIEIGLGIHGEPGAAKVPAMPADQLVQHMVQQIDSSPHFGSLTKGERLVLLVNNLGATPPLEMSVVVRAALECLYKQYGAIVERVYCAPLMTSLDMAGMSLTLLKLQQANGAGGGPPLLELLDTPVGAPGWPQGPAAPNTGAEGPTAVPGGPGGKASSAAQRPAELTAEGRLLERAIAAAAVAVVEAAEQLDKLDSMVGDGDCGSTLAQGARTILADLKTKYNLNQPELAAGALSTSVHSVGGTSGGMYGVFFAAAARSLKELGPEVTPAVWARAFKAGVEAVQKYGGASLGARTMLDALHPAAEACMQAVQQGEDVGVAATRAADAAAAAAEATKSMAATVGRASYVPADVVATVPDPGAVAVATWLRAVAGVLSSPSS